MQHLSKPGCLTLIMKPALVLLSLIFSSGILFAQGNRLNVKLAPLALIDDIGLPTIQGGIEWSVSKKISWYNEFGIKYRKALSENSDTDFVSSRGFKFKTEIRYYLLKLSRKELRRSEGFYLGVNFFYYKNAYNTGIDYYYHQDPSDNRHDDFSVHKTISGLNLLFGRQQKWGNRLMVDFYGGPGIRFRNISTDNLEYDDQHDGRTVPVDFNIIDIRHDIDITGGKTVFPNLTLGVRFCYRL